MNLHIDSGGMKANRVKPSLSSGGRLTEDEPPTSRSQLCETVGYRKVAVTATPK